MQEHFVGDVITLRGEFRDKDDALFNPSAVTFKVTVPTGGTTTLGTPTNVSTGIYEIAYTIAAVGTHTWWVTGTGANAKSARETFVVQYQVP
jgi:hypothetical protein